METNATRSNMEPRGRVFTLLAAVLWLVLMSAVAADPPLSDVQKKQAVYQMYRDYKQDDFPRIPDISPDSAMALARGGHVVFVDTRTRAEMDVSMLPGAIAKDQFLQNIDRYRESTVVAYCTISYRSGSFVRDLNARGLAAWNLRGGILAWTLEGGTVYHGGRPTQRLHVYGDKWDYAPDGYETIQFGFFRRLFNWLF